MARAADHFVACVAKGARHRLLPHVSTQNARRRKTCIEQTFGTYTELIVPVTYCEYGSPSATIHVDILLVGDVILSVNNFAITCPRSAQSLGSFTSDENYEKTYNSVAALKPVDILVITIFREGK